MIFDADIKRTENGYIDKDQILEYVTEEQIFALVFGFEPKEYDFVTSPFRSDRTPGCFFNYATNGKLRFTDFGNMEVYGKIKLFNIDCFDAVQVYFQLPSYFATLKFIKEKLIQGKELPKIQKIEVVTKTRERTQIFIEPRVLTLEDKEFWQDRYGITRENLLEDRVFALNKFKLVNHSTIGECLYKCKTIQYCYTDFSSGNKKIYRPFEKKRFLTNCPSNDIGGLRYLDKQAKNLVITKSYKDWRVLKNQGVNCIWFQNEGAIPSLELLLPICFMYDRIVVFFDNDEAGLVASLKVMNLINTHIPNVAEALNLPLQYADIGVSDPSDLHYIKGRVTLIKYLTERNLIN